MNRSRLQNKTTLTFNHIIIPTKKSFGVAVAVVVSVVADAGFLSRCPLRGQDNKNAYSVTYCKQVRKAK